MNNRRESEKRLRDAQAALRSAAKNLKIEEFRIVVQQAQMCVELSAKAIIAYFAEPQWTYNPSRQLFQILAERKDEITQSLRKDSIASLELLAQWALELAPWHGWSVYGKEENGVLISAEELCKKDLALQSLEKAKKAFQIAKNFVDSIKSV